MVELTQLGFRIGGRWALKDISLRVPEGEVFGLAGPNGGGKSLLLAICATVVRPHAGTVRIGGQDARSHPSVVRRLIGYVPEEVGMYPNMTVREDLEFFAGAHGMAREAGRNAATDALDRWGLQTVADVPMRHLSRGFLRRVALARALLHRPRLLLLDDPASGLDSEARVMLHRELRRHIDGGGSALVTSHGDPELALWSHRTGIIVAGSLKDMVESRGLGEDSLHDSRMPAALMDRGPS